MKTKEQAFEQRFADLRKQESKRSFFAREQGYHQGWKDSELNQIQCLEAIREAVGDPEGKLMQDELVEKIEDDYTQLANLEHDYAVSTKRNETFNGLIEAANLTIAQLKDDKKVLRKKVVMLREAVESKRKMNAILTEELEILKGEFRIEN